jgi:hypothetical protein
MGRFFLILSLVVAFSCKEKRDSIDDFATNQKDKFLEGFSFSIDTLMVDTGEDFINFGIPFIAAQSPDSKFYYILNYKTVHLQKIDLDSLKLIDTFRFEKDGPNSPGFTITFQPISEESFFFPNFQKPTIIHKSGEKTRAWSLNPNDIVDLLNGIFQRPRATRRDQS